MKKFLLVLCMLPAILVFDSCKNCRRENPRARIVNNGSDKVSVQVKTTGGNTVNINNILAGNQSDYAFYAPGIVQFTIAFQVAADTSFSVTMAECWEYDILINANDKVSSVPADRNER
jgi:hypothetical protein